jgi:hypothetical protein
LNINKDRFLAYFVTLSFSTAFIISLSFITTFAYQSLQNEDERYSPHTKVGPILIANKTEKEAKALLLKNVSKWKEIANFEIVNVKDERVSITGQAFTFAIEETMRKVKNGEQNSLVITINDEMVFSKALKELVGDEKEVNKNSVKKQLLLNANALIATDMLIVNDFLIQNDTVVISESAVTNYTKDEYIEFWISTLNGTIIPASEAFSLLQTLQSSAIKPIKSDSLNVIATGIYKAVLNTNFEIVQRHISRTLPPYTNLGFEAKVVPDQMDLIIYNPNENDYELKVYEENNILFVSVIGAPLDNKYVISIKDKQQFEPKTIIHFSNRVDKNNRVIENEGRPGYLGKIYRNVFDNENNLVGSVLISEDFYPPEHRIEIRNEEN